MGVTVTGVKKVKNNYKRLIVDIADRKTAKLLVKAAVLGAGYAKEITPREYGTLINSQYINPVKTESNGLSIEVGYVSDYAGHLHGDDTYTPLWKPRPPEEKEGPSWNYLAVPRFLELGFTGLTAKPAIEKIFIDGYRLK